MRWLQRVVRQGAGVKGTLPSPALDLSHGQEMSDLLTSAWSWGDPGILILPWERCEKIGLMTVETHRKEGGRER